MNLNLLAARTLRLIAGAMLVCSVAACSSAGSLSPAQSGLPSLGGASSTRGIKAMPGAKSKGFTLMYAFKGAPDGDAPVGLALDKAGNVFGATQSGGTNDLGAAFVLNENGSASSDTVLYSFGSTGDGSYPGAPPLVGKGDPLFFTTEDGGAYAKGAALELESGASGYAETALHSFGNGNDGSFPEAAPSERGKRVFATTATGGLNGSGTIASLSPDGLSETDVHDFNGTDGSFPRGSLVADAKGALYGTTGGGGANQRGTVFKFVPTKTGGTLTTIWNFAVVQGDGLTPNGGLAIDKSGNLYGTTTGGGALNNGIVFKLSPTAKGYNESVLYSFTGGSSDGAAPDAGLALKGTTLYGSTENGGNPTCSFGCGTIFQISTAGTKYQVLHLFAGSDGQFPGSTLVVHGSTLYGTAGGGANGAGVIFSYVP